MIVAACPLARLHTDDTMGEGLQAASSLDLRNHAGIVGVMESDQDDSQPRGPMDSDPPPTPPEKPLAMDCCESGCDRCVFEVYADDLAHYQAALAAWQQRQSNATHVPEHGP